MGKTDINMWPVRRFDGQKYRVKRFLQDLQAGGENKRILMDRYDDIRSFGDCIDILTERIWISFVDDNLDLLQAPTVVLAYAWYYGLQEGVISPSDTYSQVVCLVRRKVIFRLLDEQEAFVGKTFLPDVEEILDRI